MPALGSTHSASDERGSLKSYLPWQSRAPGKISSRDLRVMALRQDCAVCSFLILFVSENKLKNLLPLSKTCILSVYTAMHMERTGLFVCHFVGWK